ncbi:MAG: ribosome maturation factor RimP [Propionibacteriaceae bacterium]|nr:ribosome maturation factor RimP [Propionibacteriaceae bacterium]
MNEPALSALLAPVVAPVDLEIDSIEVRGSASHPLLRIRLDGDGPDGTGPTLDQIAEATKLISRALDDAPKVTGNDPYTLEVSSRGTNRPLTTPAHFRRNRGRLVALDLRDGTSVLGRIVGADDAQVELESGTFAYTGIAKAVVQVELKRMPSSEPESDDEDTVIAPDGED